jgi:hypothetical protein
MTINQAPYKEEDRGKNEHDSRCGESSGAPTPNEAMSHESDYHPYSRRKR